MFVLLHTIQVALPAISLKLLDCGFRRGKR